MKTMTANERSNKSILLGVLASAFAFLTACAPSPMQIAEANYELGVDEMQKGYIELGKVVNDLEDDKENAAMRHFNKALQDFDKAVVYFAKAELPPSQQAAVAPLKKGLDALEKAVKAMEKNNSAAAQEYYDEAQKYFAQASNLLEAS